MPRLMRCLYCGTLQDEPTGAKTCIRCGGELSFVSEPPANERGSYLQVQMELDQVMAPAGQNVERHLLITLRAPAQVPADQAAPTTAGRPPLSLTAVLDVSGSMQGDKIRQAKDAVRQAVSRLHDDDSLALVTFSNVVQTVLAPTTVDEHIRQVVQSALQEINAGGRTALGGGLEEGLKHAGAVQQETNLVLLLSDGQANVGETDIEKVGYRAYEGRQKGLIVSTLGVGLDYNEALMVEVATQGGGRFYHIQRPDQIGAYLAGELGEVAALAARETQIHLTIPAGAIVMPLSAGYPTQQDGGHATITVGDVPCDTELEIPVRVALAGQRPGNKLSFEGNVTYRSPAGNQLRSSLNRVTVRFVEKPAFQLRAGLVPPVAERVLEHIKAANVLSVARAMAKSPGEGQKQREAGLSRLRAYASLLGEERAVAEVEESQIQFRDFAAAPQMAKAGISAAFARQRGAKKFGKDST
jgi:Ca-activated chloride channel family protein